MGSETLLRRHAKSRRRIACISKMIYFLAAFVSVYYCSNPIIKKYQSGRIILTTNIVRKPTHMNPPPAVVEKRKSEAERESREEGEATQMGQVKFSVILLVSSSFNGKRLYFLIV